MRSGRYLANGKEYLRLERLVRSENPLHGGRAETGLITIFEILNRISFSLQNLSVERHEH